MLLHAGAAEVLVVREVEEARAAKVADPGVLLFGERGGLPPAGFDSGNSPRDVATARGRRVVLTTTTGAGRLVDSWGARAVLMGSSVNASAVVEVAKGLGGEVVLIPAGLKGDPSFDAQEDWAAAAAIAMRAAAPIGEGADACARWQERIESEGLPQLFHTAPHAAKLRAIGLHEDVAYCAQVDLTRAVPQAALRNNVGVVCLPANGAQCPPVA